MSTPSHQQLEDEEEKKSHKESYVDTGQQKCSTASEDITVKNEPQTHSTEQDRTLKYNTDKVSQDNTTGSPAGQEYTSSYSKFLYCSTTKAEINLKPPVTVFPSSLSKELQFISCITEFKKTSSGLL